MQNQRVVPDNGFNNLISCKGVSAQLIEGKPEQVCGQCYQPHCTLMPVREQNRDGTITEKWVCPNCMKFIFLAIPENVEVKLSACLR